MAGTHITGASPQHGGYTGASVCDKNFGGSSFYSLVSGTSQASPHVAGAAALLRDWYVRQVGPQALAGTHQGDPREQRLDIAGGDSGKNSSIPAAPNTDEGWGRVNGRVSTRPSASTSTRPRPRRSTRTARASCALRGEPTRRSRSA